MGSGSRAAGFCQQSRAPLVGAPTSVSPDSIVKFPDEPMLLQVICEECGYLLAVDLRVVRVGAGVVDPGDLPQLSRGGPGLELPGVVDRDELVGGAVDEQDGARHDAADLVDRP